MNSPPSKPRLPVSQRTSYQFPVYRWIGWLAVAGFTIGLTMMFFVAGLFGIPAPIGWAALVILFTMGALLLDRPKLLLLFMMFYFMMIPSNRLLGLISLPLPAFIDELFFLPLIAVIVMNWIQRRQLKEATLFPLAFCLISALSWYVNRPPIFTVVQVTLIMLKSYIVWYYCRLTCTFESERQMMRWVWGYIFYVLIQFPYNVLWQHGLWPKFSPDRSGGILGPAGTGSAHIVGYLSVFALLLIAGWWASMSSHVRGSKRRMVFLVAMVIGYNLVFMTDTKHALILMPFAFIPFLLHPKFPTRLRLALISGGMIFILATTVYFHITMGGQRFRPFFSSFADSPKGKMVYAVTTDFSHLVPYPLLGAGPGRFASSQAAAAKAPLARRYILPYSDERRRLGYFGMSGSVVSASILGIPQTDLFVLMGEFGWLGAVAYYLFLGWIIKRLWQKSILLPLNRPASGLFMSLCCCMIFLIFTTTLMSSATIPMLVFPLWILIGRMWDMQTDNPVAAAV